VDKLCATTELNNWSNYRYDQYTQRNNARRNGNI